MPPKPKYKIKRPKARSVWLINPKTRVEKSAKQYHRPAAKKQVRKLTGPM